MMKTRTIVIAIVVILVLAWAYWFFIGPALFTQRVDETLPIAAPVEPVPIAPEAEAAPEEAPVQEAEQAVVLKQGEFIEIDKVHKGSGMAKIVKQGDKHYLTLEDFEVTNGPDLFVYLSENKDITDEDQLGEFKTLQPLKGNVGNQVYEISEEDAENFESVVIWCKRFGVLFSSATLN